MTNTIRRYFPDGSLESERPQKDGLPHGTHHIWSPNSTLIEETVWDMGVPVRGTRWDLNGKELGSYELHNGTGVCLFWHENGQVMAEETWTNGKTSGRYRSFDMSGSVLEQIYYVNGRKISKKRYDQACEYNPQLPRYDADEPVTYSGPFDELTDFPDRFWPDPPTEEMKRDAEKRVKMLLQSPDAREARTWLTESTEPERTLGESTSQEDSLDLVNELYALGASKVTVADIDGEAHEPQNSGVLIVVLPKDPRSREKVFAYCNELAEEIGYDSVSDYGQKHHILILD